jgi:FAD synthetase
MKQIIKVNEIGKLPKQKIVLVGGCFDILHLGHIVFLEKAKSYGEYLIILLESDQTIKKLKGINRPIHTQFERAKVLSAIKYVDFIILLPEMIGDNTYDELVKNIKPSVIATTKGDPGLIHKKRQAKLVGVKLTQIPRVPEKSTTNIINH